MTNTECKPTAPSLFSYCLDCGTDLFCGVAHGAGHDHSDAARECSRLALLAG